MTVTPRIVLWCPSLGGFDPCHIAHNPSEQTFKEDTSRDGLRRELLRGLGEGLVWAAATALAMQSRQRLTPLPLCHCRSENSLRG